MREEVPYYFSLTGVIAVLAVFVTIGAAFLVKQFSKDPKKKASEDKALLKELLEGFGLEVPAELNEQNGTVVNSIKRP